MKIGKPCHLKVRTFLVGGKHFDRIACGQTGAEYSSFDTGPVDCLRCKRTKIYGYYKQYYVSTEGKLFLKIKKYENVVDKLTTRN